ncbi:MAG: hypothetical protein IPL12_20855 [Bacteroidetes bacterium]|nr:hypothetical protein [Bacteroidota bacterium]
MRTLKLHQWHALPGYTCTGAARLILDNKFTRKGVSTPEFVGEDENNFKDMMAYLAAR